MSYLDQWRLVQSEDFKGRLAMALVAAAQNVVNEANTVANHGQRLRLANAILTNATSYVPMFLQYVANNATIAAAGPVNSADGDLDYVIAQYFTAVAKAA